MARAGGGRVGVVGGKAGTHAPRLEGLGRRVCVSWVVWELWEVWEIGPGSRHGSTEFCSTCRNLLMSFAAAHASVTRSFPATTIVPDR